MSKKIQSVERAFRILEIFISGGKEFYRVSDIATLEFSTNKPLLLTFEIAAGGTLRYYLAPRMEA